VEDISKNAAQICREKRLDVALSIILLLKADAMIKRGFYSMILLSVMQVTKKNCN
jgi:hypothetical protein